MGDEVNAGLAQDPADRVSQTEREPEGQCHEETGENKKDSVEPRRCLVAINNNGTDRARASNEGNG